jgi:hypothetical protein
MEGGLSRQTAPDLPMQGAVWQTDPDRQFAERTALEGGAAQIAVVGHSDLFAVFEC